MDRRASVIARSGSDAAIANWDLTPIRFEKVLKSAIQFKKQLQFIKSVDPMEHMIQLHIEKLPEGVYLATSDDVQGLVAQGRTIQETIEIARDVAKKLIEAMEDAPRTHLAPVREMFDYPLIVAT